MKHKIMVTQESAQKQKTSASVGVFGVLLSGLVGLVVFAT